MHQKHAEVIQWPLFARAAEQKLLARPKHVQFAELPNTDWNRLIHRSRKVLV
jgi:hypothetical protein